MNRVMIASEYQSLAQRTNVPVTDKVAFDNLLHAGMGLCTEVGEFMDMLKRHIAYGAERDDVNLGEEIGDILWYCAIALDQLGLSFEEVMEANIDKLRNRFPDKFPTGDQALDRDVGEEREILEDGLA